MQMSHSLTHSLRMLNLIEGRPKVTRALDARLKEIRLLDSCVIQICIYAAFVKTSWENDRNNPDDCI